MNDAATAPRIVKSVPDLDTPEGMVAVLMSDGSRKYVTPEEWPVRVRRLPRAPMRCDANRKPKRRR